MCIGLKVEVTLKLDEKLSGQVDRFLDLFQKFVEQNEDKSDPNCFIIGPITEQK